MSLKPSLSHPAILLATWFGVGRLPKAPGTWGSLAALPFAWLIATMGGVMALLGAIVAVFLAGCWAAHRYRAESGLDDPGAIVVDEVAGQWLVLLASPPDLFLYAAGFALFRLLDITKPWPAGWADRSIKSGFGVMLDDVLAALYGLVALYLIRMGVKP